MSFENKSAQIESYLAEIEEREKEWLERDDTAKSEESKTPYVQMAVPVAINPPKSTENNDIKSSEQFLSNG